MKPFTNGEYINECLIAEVEKIRPEKIGTFKQISLSHQTEARRIADISIEISTNLFSVSKNVVYFSLALDETTDIKDTSQLAIFIREVDKQMNITEEMLELKRLKNTTKERDIKDAMLDCLKGYEINYKKNKLALRQMVLPQWLEKKLEQSV